MRTGSCCLGRCGRTGGDPGTRPAEQQGCGSRRVDEFRVGSLPSSRPDCLRLTMRTALQTVSSRPAGPPSSHFVLVASAVAQLQTHGHHESRRAVGWTCSLRRGISNWLVLETGSEGQGVMRRALKSDGTWS